MATRRASVLLAALVFAGCTNIVPVEERYVSEEVKAVPSTLMIDKPIVLVIPPEREREVRKQRPSSVTGYSSQWEISIGRILSETTIAYFQAASTEPIAVAPSVPERRDGSRYILEPEISLFDWELDQARNVGFAITPQARVALSLSSHDPLTYAIATECDSGWVNGRSYAIATLNGVKSRVSQTITRALVQCLEQIGQTIPRGTHEPITESSTSRTFDDNHAKLIQLKDLRDRDIISEEEYELKRQELLDAF